MIIGYCIIAYLAHLVLVYFSSCVGTGITVMIMNRLVVKEDNYESFIMDVYNRVLWLEARIRLENFFKR
jgi:hypothetical protein